MAVLDEVAVTNQEGEMERPDHPPGEHTTMRSSWGVKDSNNVGDSGDRSPSGQNPGNLKVDGNEKQTEQPALGKNEYVEPPREKLRAKFYDHYRKGADEYDKEFTKKYNDDLDVTLIFAGLFSAVTSAFIIQVSSGLQPDPNEETAALLRVLIYKVDNTTFGDSVPTIPQPWTGPPRMIVQVQAILFASLAASLFSAFLAMLGKQWLNRYASVDMRGSAIERSQNRQRKLDGIDNWYFDHLMESLPLMLQAALLLLGCALSRYLWEIDTTVASVVLGVTSFGVLFYLLIVIAGAAFVSCPYQTPGARILFRVLDPILNPLRHVPDIPRRIKDIFRHILHTLSAPHSVSFPLVGFCLLSVLSSILLHFTSTLLLRHHSLVLLLPLTPLTLDASALITRLLAGFCRWVHKGLKQQAAVLDLHCISWTLQTSLDGPVRASALDYLATTTMAESDPTLVVYCFDILLGSIKVIDGEVVINQGLEGLATASTVCCLHTLSHIIATGPTPKVLKATRQRYVGAFPLQTNFNGSPFFHTLGLIHSIFYPSFRSWYIRELCDWLLRGGHKLPSNEQVMVEHALTKIAWLEYHQERRGKVPRFLLRFALYHLSQSPLPPTSVVINCLSIIATDLGCVLNTVVSDESVQLDQVSRLITQELMDLADNPNLVRSKRKAISALFPYTVHLAQDGWRGMVDTFSRVARASNSVEFIWHLVRPYITTLFDKPNSPSLDWVITLISPHILWHDGSYDENAVTRWAAAASTVSTKVYAEEASQNVVDALLQIASIDSLRPHIPGETWAWLKRQPALSRNRLCRLNGPKGSAVRHARTFGDEILKSYLLLVWSEWDCIDDQSGGLDEMRIAIREDFSGIEKWHHRKDLIKRLDRILGQLGRRLEDCHRRTPRTDEDNIQRAMEQYRELKRVLQEVNG